MSASAGTETLVAIGKVGVMWRMISPARAAGVAAYSTADRPVARARLFIVECPDRGRRWADESARLSHREGSPEFDELGPRRFHRAQIVIYLQVELRLPGVI